MLGLLLGLKILTPTLGRVAINTIVEVIVVLRSFERMMFASQHASALMHNIQYTSPYLATR
jgi:hypothetical protein